MKINYQPDIFDDPEFCGDGSGRCKYLGFTAHRFQTCTLFDQTIYLEEEKYKNFVKCYQCKKYYQEAKSKTIKFKNGSVSFSNEKPEFKKWNTKHIQEIKIAPMIKHLPYVDYIALLDEAEKKK